MSSNPKFLLTIGDSNGWADYWRYKIGVNVIAADSRNKRPLISWAHYQESPISEEQHNQWKSENAFSKGIAIVLGKVWHRPDKKGYYLVGIDTDNAIAIREICNRPNGNTSNEGDVLSAFANKTLVEQHKDNPDKAHFYLYSPRLVTKKGSDIDPTNPGISNGLKTNEIPAMEVKCQGSIMICTPSIHKNGHPYEIIGACEPLSLSLDQTDEFEKHIDNICRKYGLKYLDAADGSGKSNASIYDLFKKDTKIYEGHNRHEALLRVMESYISRNRDVLLEEQIKQLSKEWNEVHCVPPLDDREFKKQWNCATRFIACKEEGNEDEREEAKRKGKGQSGDKQSEVESNCLAELESKIPTKDFVDVVINTAKKTVKQEDTLVRQILYTGLSAHTNDPLNLGIMAPTSEGKTYPVIEVMKFFAIDDVWYIGHMSPMTLVRQKGILVDKNNQPIGAIVKKLKKEMFLLGNGKQDKANMLELKEQLSELLENSKRLIDLNGRIILFLEPPHPELWDKIKPILSHDKLEIEFPYVDKSDRDGISSQNVVVRGWPACIFCSAKDESKWPQWPEIVSRFLITSPNMISKKYQESNLLIAHRKGLPSLLQQEIIVSDEDIRIAKQCILYIKQEIQKLATAKENNNVVWIPYGEILAEILPGERGTDNRVTKRIFSLLDIIPLTKSHLRPKLIYGSETLVVATLEDLREVLRITQNLNGIPTYKMKFFKETFNPLYRSKNVHDKSSDGSKEERIIAVTVRQLCEYYKEKTGKTINSDSLRKIYLNELLNNGIIEEENSVIDQRLKIYYSLIDLPAAEQQEESNEEDKMKKLRERDQSHNFSYPYAINMPRYCRNIPEDWLIFQILALVNCRIGLSEIALFSHMGNKMTIAEFVKQYEQTDNLILYFCKPNFGSFHGKIFGDMKYIGKLPQNTCEKLRERDQSHNFFIIDKRISMKDKIDTVRPTAMAVYKDPTEKTQDSFMRSDSQLTSHVLNESANTTTFLQKKCSNGMNGVYPNHVDRGSIVQPPPNITGITSEQDELEAIREDVFWQRFKELEQKSPKGTVKGDELRGSLVSSGKFYQSDAAMIIVHLVKTGKMEEVSFDTFRKRAAD